MKTLCWKIFARWFLIETYLSKSWFPQFIPKMSLNFPKPWSFFVTKRELYCILQNKTKQKILGYGKYRLKSIDISSQIFLFKTYGRILLDNLRSKNYNWFFKKSKECWKKNPQVLKCNEDQSIHQRFKKLFELVRNWE